MLEELLRIAVVMEMLIVNLSAVNICAVRRYSGVKTLFSIVIFTFILTYFTHSLWPLLGFERGNAVFALIGSIYLLPLSLLYRETLKRITSILFSSWIYTMFVYCLAVQLSSFLPKEYYLQAVLLIQSALYLGTLFFFICWLKRDFLYILGNLTPGTETLLRTASLCWFGTLILIEAALIYTEVDFLRIATLFALLLEVLLSHQLIYSLVKSSRKIKNLEDIVYVDALTGLFNRSRLFLDADTLTKRKKSFRLFFIDLNQFKDINDTYGHLAGDRYLIDFSDAMRTRLHAGENLYRMSGDEFVILSQGRDRLNLAKRLENFPSCLSDPDIPFNGFSVGWSDYPEEAGTLDRLISLADHRMYENKEKNRIAGAATANHGAPGNPSDIKEAVHHAGESESAGS